ncbi:hypothetical protein GTQ40_07260 [Flavobacteriaceae bacterium R38]|nr:hypothetical protein [Flavobacteriaceae bacterium R38]
MKNYKLLQIIALTIFFIGAILAVYGRESNNGEFGKTAFYGNVILTVGLLSIAVFYYLKRKNK